MASYLELLNLTREPFSNSPDPDAYYRTSIHEACLNRLEIAIRLKRGLNIVFGEVGTGKSTLCRCLLRTLTSQEGVDVFLLLDAGFDDADSFVAHLCELIVGTRPPEGASRRACIGLIQNRVFERALEQGVNMVLFVDEGQKLGPAALEVLRELLNFETNTEKLLQIVIFGQPELEEVVNAIPNFKDRINESLYLRPLSLRESIRLVRHRLRLAGGRSAERLFSLGSLIALHHVSKGRPRQLMRLGHQMLIALLVGDRRTVTRSMVLAQASRNGGKVRWERWVLGACMVVGIGAVFFPRPLQEAVLSQVGQTVERLTPSFLRTMPESEVKGAVNGGGQPETLSGSQAPLVSPVAAPSTNLSPVHPVKNPKEAPSDSAGSVSGSEPEHVGTGSDVDAKSVFPEDLGLFTMTPEDKLTDVVRTVYGTAAALEAVQKRNPGYRSGAFFSLRLPAVLSPAPRQLSKGLLLSLGDFSGAEEAYRALQSYGKRKLSLELVPIWRAETGLRFHLLAPRSFTSEQSAWSWVSRFSPPSSASIRLIPPLNEESSVFHTFIAP